ncbi:MAG: amino acid--tRNA ligase-related protein [Kiritimatiellia bacterium]
MSIEYRSNDSPFRVPCAAVIRSKVLMAVRDFFHGRGYIEVETPVRIEAPPPELHIDAEPCGNGYLRTSPELHMKRLLAEGYGRIFQMGPCFRRGEKGPFHNPEYTMLEWYRCDADYMDMLRECRKLLIHVCRKVLGSPVLNCRSQKIHLARNWNVITVNKAFRNAAGWDPITSFDPDRFDVDLVTKVIPSFPADVPTVIKDYPAETAAMARCGRPPQGTAERLEVFAGGLELANAFSELTDPAEQKARFRQWRAERRRAGRDIYPEDTLFLAAMESGLPPSAGTALGVDRLVMLAADCLSIDMVRAFTEG